MSLQIKIMDKIKEAMKNKDKVALESLRAIKSEILLEQTKGGANGELTEDLEVKLLQKLVKQRKDSAAVYISQNRQDLADPELAQAEIISQFLPEQLDEESLTKIIVAIVTQVGATSMKDMVAVMTEATKQLAGKADGKAISMVVKKILG